MSKLPRSWALSTFGELNRFESRTLDPSTHPNETFDLYSVPSFPSSQPERVMGNQIGSTKQTVASDDVLVCKINPRINRTWHIGPKGEHELIASSEWIGFRSEALQPRFANHYFASPSFRELLCSEVAGVGGSLTRAQPKKVATYPVPVAPLAEQTRIADELDKLLASIQSCNDRLDAIPALLKRFRWAVLDAVTTGALSQGWREEQAIETTTTEFSDLAKTKKLHTLPDGWRWLPFSDLMASIRSGTSGVPKVEPSPYPVLRSSSVRPMGIDLRDVRYLPTLTKVRADDLLTVGDMLFTRLSGSLEYVANCVFIRDLEGRTVYYPDRLFRAKLLRPEQGPYFELCFASPMLRKYLTVEAKSTAGHQRISMGAITNFPIPFPPENEQLEIVRRVETLFKLADRIEARYTAARTQAQRLSPLLLAKAFHGELVPQDPDDEPASVLLERIAAEREKAAAQPRARKSSAGRRVVRAPKENASVTKSRQDEDVQGQPYLARHLRLIGGTAPVEALFKASELPVADFYKQLAWEVANGHLRDGKTVLELDDAA